VYSKSVTEILRSTCPRAIQALSRINPNKVEDIPVVGPDHISCRRQKSIGTTLHESFANSISGCWVNRDVWPYCQVAKEWLDEQCVVGIKVEEPLQSSKRHGVCDVIGAAGGKVRFILDWKYRPELPLRPHPKNVYQLGLYASLATDSDHISGALAYISLKQRQFRIFRWESLGGCAAEADRLAA
jgi:hypothetical protein